MSLWLTSYIAHIVNGGSKKLMWRLLVIHSIIEWEESFRTLYVDCNKTDQTKKKINPEPLTHFVPLMEVSLTFLSAPASFAALFNMDALLGEQHWFLHK